MLNWVIKRTAKQRQVNLRNDEGSVILETALILPVVLGLLLFIINFINMAAVYLAMDHAVGETVREMASHAPAYEKIVDGLVKDILRKQIKLFYPLGTLEDKDFSITDVTLGEEVTVTVIYRFRPAVPLFAREITMSNSAVERAW